MRGAACGGAVGGLGAAEAAGRSTRLAARGGVWERGGESSREKKYLRCIK